MSNKKDSRIYRQVAIKEDRSIVEQMQDEFRTHLDGLSSAQPVKEGKKCGICLLDTCDCDCLSPVKKSDPNLETEDIHDFIDEVSGFVGCNKFYRKDVIAIIEAYKAKKQPLTPPASKEVKSALEILNQHECYRGQPHLYHYLEAQKAIYAYAAQHQQSEGMVEVERLYDLIFKGKQRTLWHLLDFRPRPTWIFAEIMELPSKNISKQLQQMADNTGLVKFEMNGKFKNWYK